MNHQSRLLPVALFFLTAIKAMGGDPQLVFVDGNDENNIVKLADVSRITFGSDGLTVTTDTDTQFPFTSLKRMVFDHDGAYTQSSIADLAADHRQGDILLDVSGQSLSVISLEEENTSLEIYTTTGRLASAIKDYRGEAVDISALPSGVYIVRTNLYSSKFIKK